MNLEDLEIRETNLNNTSKLHVGENAVNHVLSSVVQVTGPNDFSMLLVKPKNKSVEAVCDYCVQMGYMTRPSPLYNHYRLTELGIARRDMIRL